MLAYITGTVDQELLVRNEYLAAENRILKAQVKADCFFRKLTRPRWRRSLTRIVKKVVRRAGPLKGHYHGFRFQACS
jgi:hypothetical protein